MLLTPFEFLDMIILVTIEIKKMHICLGISVTTFAKYLVYFQNGCSCPQQPLAKDKKILKNHVFVRCFTQKR